MTPHPKLELGEVQVWQASLAADAERLSRLRQHLSDEEMSRARRLCLPRLRERFVAGRGVVREILAGYLAEKPASVRLSLGPSGKPALSDAVENNLRFNVSHSGDIMLLAVTLEHEVGVDLEAMRHDIAYGAMARRYFSSAEQNSLFSLPPERQLNAFYRCWTRKEAYLKGTGDGFTQPCNCFDVSILPGEPAALLQHRNQPDEARKWQLHDLECPDSYCAALAVAGECRHVTYLSLT